MAVWSTIRRARVVRGWSQKDLGSAAGLDQAQVSRMETGDWMPPREVLIAVAQVLEAPQILLEALRHSPILAEALAMLGVAGKDSRPVELIASIRAELDALEASLPDPSAAVRAAQVTDMCRLLTLLLAERDLHR